MVVKNILSMINLAVVLSFLQREHGTIFGLLIMYRKDVFGRPTTVVRSFYIYYPKILVVISWHKT
jgi:hypothetical protein